MLLVVLAGLILLSPLVYAVTVGDPVITDRQVTDR
jgi:hypothetical protein